MRTKGEATAAFKQFKAWAENKTGLRIGGLRDDKGGEYVSKELEDFSSSTASSDSTLCATDLSRTA